MPLKPNFISKLPLWENIGSFYCIHQHKTHKHLLHEFNIDQVYSLWNKLTNAQAQTKQKQKKERTKKWWQFHTKEEHHLEVSKVCAFAIDLAWWKNFNCQIFYITNSHIYRHSTCSLQTFSIWLGTTCIIMQLNAVCQYLFMVWA